MFGRLLGRSWLCFLFICSLFVCDSQSSSGQLFRRLRERASQSAAAAARPPAQQRVPAQQPQRVQPNQAVVQPNQAVVQPGQAYVNQGALVPGSTQPQQSILVDSKTGQQITTTQRKLPLYRQVSTGRVFVVDPQTGRIIGDANSYRIYMDPQSGRPFALDQGTGAQVAQSQVPQVKAQVPQVKPQVKLPLGSQNGNLSKDTSRAPQVAIAKPATKSEPMIAGSTPAPRIATAQRPLSSLAQPTVVKPNIVSKPSPAPRPASLEGLGKSILANDEPPSVAIASPTNKPSAKSPSLVRPTLGLQVVESKSGTSAVFIDDFKPHSLADEAGLRQGDRIVALNGRATNSIATLAQEISKFTAGDRVTLRVGRNSQLLDIRVPLVEHPLVASSRAAVNSASRGGIALGSPQVAAKPKMQAPEPAIASPLPGQSVSARTGTAPGQKGALGVDVVDIAGKRGVEVVKVYDNSPAKNAGLAVGDRIVSVDGRMVTNGVALAREVKMMKDPAGSLAVQFVREEKLIAMSVEMSRANQTKSIPSVVDEGATAKSAGGVGSFLGGLLGGGNSKATPAKKQESSKGSVTPKLDDSVKLAVPSTTAEAAKPSVLAPVGFEEMDDLAFGDDEPIDRADLEVERSSTQTEVAPSEKEDAQKSVEKLQAEIDRLKEQLEKMKSKSKKDEA